MKKSNQKFDLKSSVPNQLVDENGNVYKSLRNLSAELGINRMNISYGLKRKGYFEHNGIKYFAVDQIPVGKNTKIEKVPVLQPREDEAEYQEFKKAKQEIKNVKDLSFKTYHFDYSYREKGTRYAIALFSDAHIEETVKPESVLGKNEYNVKIAEERIRKYFENLAHCLNTDLVDDLIFASLGDTISSYIHSELEQCNELSPIKAVHKAQSLIFNGLKFICDKTNLKTIKFIGIVGNHSRTTKKIQHSNGYEMSYEWLMYQNIKERCEEEGLPIEFAIPESEIAIADTPDNKRLLFCHGFQIKAYTSSICGIYPALQRYALRLSKTFQQDRIYMGHFHSCISIPTTAVNGSIIGYNAFSLSNGFELQEPCQYYEVIDTNIGQLLERKIYCK